MTEQPLKLSEEDIENNEVSYEDNRHEWEVRIPCESERIAKHLTAKILEAVKKAEKWDSQKYIYEQNYEKAVKDFNNLTEEEYRKYSSIAVCLTWLANKEKSKNKAIVEKVIEWVKIQKVLYDTEKYIEDLKGLTFNPWTNLEDLEKILNGEDA